MFARYHTAGLCTANRNQGRQPRTALFLAGLLCLLFLCPGCAVGAGADRSVSEVLPGAGAVPGWTQQETTQTYTPDTLYELVNGQADAFLAYGLDQAALARYAGPQGAILRIEVFRLASEADAYGLFGVSTSGEPVPIGAGADFDSGRRLAFWQDRYYVRMQTPRPIADQELLAFARAIAGALPSGGKPPRLAAQLPTAGLQARSARFFRQEISIQSWLWLGGTNVLGLGPDTAGVLADYDLSGQQARLLLIEYPQAAQAERAQEALRTGNVQGLIVSQVKERTLGAVFGAADTPDAESLLREALR